MNISLFKTVTDYNDVNNPFATDHLKVLHGIRDGRWKELVTWVSDPLINKTEYDNRKKKLPAALWSGTFSRRSIDGFKESSGLLCIDFDKLSDSDMASLCVTLKNNQYVYAMFVSPSQKGVKVLVKCDFANADEYKSRFCAIDLHLGRHLAFDLSCSDISRACFVSHDPQIHINDDAIKFEGFENDPDEYLKVRRLELPEGTFKALKASLTKTGENYTDGNRNRYIFKLACGMCRYGINEDTTLGICIKNYSDLDIEELKMAVKSAYKRSEFGIRRIGDSPPDKEGKYYKSIDVPDFTFDPQMVLDDPEETNRLVHAIARKEIKSISMGLPAMDAYFPFKKKEYYVFVAPSKAGKTQTVSFLMLMGAKASGLKFMVLTTETNVAEYKATMVGFLCDKHITLCGEEDRNKALAFIDQHFQFIKNEVDHLNILDVYHFAMTKGVDIDAIVLDPLSNIKKSKKLSSSATEYYEELHSEYLKFSKKYCAIWNILHVNTESERNRSHPYIQNATHGAEAAKRCHVGVTFFRNMYDESAKTVTEMHVRYMRSKLISGGDTTVETSPICLEFKNTYDRFGYDITVDGIKWINPLHTPEHREFMEIPPMQKHIGPVDMSRIEKEPVHEEQTPMQQLMSNFELEEREADF